MINIFWEYYEIAEFWYSDLQFLHVVEIVKMMFKKKWYLKKH